MVVEHKVTKNKHHHLGNSSNILHHIDNRLVGTFDVGSLVRELEDHLSVKFLLSWPSLSFEKILNSIVWGSFYRVEELSSELHSRNNCTFLKQETALSLHNNL